MICTSAARSYVTGLASFCSGVTDNPSGVRNCVFAGTITIASGSNSTNYLNYFVGALHSSSFATNNYCTSRCFIDKNGTITTPYVGTTGHVGDELVNTTASLSISLP